MGIGIGMAAVGAAALAVGGFFDYAAYAAHAGVTPETSAREIVAINNARPGQAAGALTGYIVGGALIAAGAAAIAVGVFE